jgi:hypothetical protein
VWGGNDREGGISGICCCCCVDGENARRREGHAWGCWCVFELVLVSYIYIYVYVYIGLSQSSQSFMHACIHLPTYLPTYQPLSKSQPQPQNENTSAPPYPSAPSLTRGVGVRILTCLLSTPQQEVVIVRLLARLVLYAVGPWEYYGMVSMRWLGKLGELSENNITVTDTPSIPHCWSSVYLFEKRAMCWNSRHVRTPSSRQLPTTPPQALPPRPHPPQSSTASSDTGRRSTARAPAESHHDR